MKKNSGFTLIEIMVVLVIIGIIAMLVVPNIISRPDQARVTIAGVDIQSIGNSLELYKLDNGNYPSTQQGLEALVKKPTGLPDAKNWKIGGYLKTIPTDPWGNPYQYVSPNANGEYDLLSFGADGKAGGKDYAQDITNQQ